MLAHVVIRRIGCPVCLGADNIANRIAKLVGTPKGKFLRSPRDTCGHKGIYGQNADRDCILLVAHPSPANCLNKQAATTRKRIVTNIDRRAHNHRNEHYCSSSRFQASWQPQHMRVQVGTHRRWCGWSISQRTERGQRQLLEPHQSPRSGAGL